MAKPFPPESAARLLETYDPVSAITAILEAAKPRGWVNGFAVMETEAGSTAAIVTKDGLTATVLEAIREATTPGSFGMAEIETVEPFDRPRTVITQLREICEWLQAEGEHELSDAADDLADDIASEYPETA